MSSKPIELVEAAIKQEQPERTPVVPLVGLFSTQASGIPISEVLRTPEKQSKSLLFALERYQYDGVFNVMDLTVEAEALGAEVTYPSHGFPYIQNHPFKDLDSIHGLDIYETAESRLSVFAEATRNLVQAVGGTHLVSSYVIGPFTLLGHLVGVEHLLERTIDEPEKVQVSVESCVKILSPYVSELIDAGAHNIVLLEPTASSSVISPAYFNSYSAPYVKMMIDEIHSEGAYATLHICGNTNKIIESMSNTGANALSIDSSVDLVAAKNSSKRATLIGNVDTTLLLQGTPQEVSSSAQRCIESAASGGGFILSSGCDIPIETPPANLEALVHAVQK